MDKDQLLKMARRAFPKPKRVREEVAAATEAVRRAGDLEVPGLESLRPPAGLNEGPAAPDEAEIFGLPRTETVDKRLKDGASALDKMSAGDTNLTPGEQLGLEAIVLLFGRPALLIQDGDFAPPPDEWKQLNGKRDLLKGIFPSVGRVDLTGHHTYEWCGTAFLVGENILMTNRHVAEIFSEKKGKEYPFLSGVKPRIDYKEEFQRDVAQEFKIEKVLGIHPTYDLSLLQVAKGTKSKPSPKPLSVSSKPPKATKDGELAVIGYPAFDSRNGRQEQLDIFNNIFNVKRLQPGKSTGLKQTPEILGHDASTLGGNSGSCIVDLDTGTVIALHFGGQYLKGNVSVPLWKLTKDTFLKKFAINWQ
ncbi:MAG: serine protease [Acidobacteriota bacterium]